jgi:hypothetical protein
MTLDLFSHNKRLWRLKKHDPSAFAGGLEVTENCPGKIGNSLNDTAMLENVLNGTTVLQDCSSEQWDEMYDIH